MDIEKVIRLMDAFSNSNLTSFKYKEGNISLHFKNTDDNSVKVESNQSVAVSESVETPVKAESMLASNQVESVEKPQVVEPEKASEVVAEETSDNYLIKSPTVGTFYQASSPDSDPFAQVGDVVKKGQVVCIVEAMKVMNEIESPIDGVVVEVSAKNEELVEFGQTLLVLKPIA